MPISLPRGPFLYYLFTTRVQAVELQGTQLLERSILLRQEMPRSYHELRRTLLV